MKKIMLILTLSVIILMAACSSSGGDYSALENIISENFSKTDDAGAYYEEEAKYAYEESDMLDDEPGSGEYYEGDEDVNVADIKDVKIPDKIIKTANVSVEVENYKESIKRIKSVIDKWQGFISNENENSYSYMASNIITIRVDSKNFGNLIEELVADVKKVENKSISAVDVSEEFVDIETRLKTKKEVEKRYIELLKKAYTVTDILYVEEKIRVVREEIEAKEGRLKYLKDRVAFSTITLEVKEYYQQDIYKPGFGEDAGDALSGGWEGFLTLLIGLLYLWPLWLIIAATLFILFKFVFKRKKKK